MYEAKLGERFGRQIVATLANDIQHALEKFVEVRPLKLDIKPADIIYIKELDYKFKK
jgi:hypothetical protein